ncbi:hypothetical protein GCM10010872_37740 [Dyella flava]|nr:hypothetical protein GCM10010872_37740 [Dyella flava]
MSRESGSLARLSAPREPSTNCDPVHILVLGWPGPDWKQRHGWTGVGTRLIPRGRITLAVIPACAGMTAEKNRADSKEARE